MAGEATKVRAAGSRGATAPAVRGGWDGGGEGLPRGGSRDPDSCGRKEGS